MLYNEDNVEMPKVLEVPLREIPGEGGVIYNLKWYVHDPLLTPILSSAVPQL